MSYKIAYASFGEEKKMPKAGQWKKGIGAVLLVTALVIGAITVKSKALPWLQGYLLPGDPAVTAAALEGMVTDLREGDSLYNALKTFCQEIVAHGTKISD